MNCVQVLDYKMCHPKNYHALHGALNENRLHILYALHQ